MLQDPGAKRPAKLVAERGGYGVGGPARITLIALHQPQPPAKYIGLNGISKVTLCYKILHKKKRGDCSPRSLFNLLG